MINEKEYYNSVAKNTEGIQAVMHTGKLLGKYRNWLEQFALNRELETGNFNICDVGCGNGRFFPLFRKKGYKISGIDFSEELIKQARKFSITEPETTSLYLEVGDCSSIPFKDNSFDKIFIILTLPHDEPSKIEKCLNEINRVMRVGGKLYILDEPNSSGSCWNEESLKKDLNSFILKKSLFIRYELVSRIFSKKRTINETQESKNTTIGNNQAKDIIRIIIDSFIDIPLIIFGAKNCGATRLLVFEKIK